MRNGFWGEGRGLLQWISGEVPATDYLGVWDSKFRGKGEATSDVSGGTRFCLGRRSPQRASETHIRNGFVRGRIFTVTSRDYP